MASLCKGSNEPQGSLQANSLVSYGVSEVSAGAGERVGGMVNGASLASRAYDNII